MSEAELKRSYVTIVWIFFLIVGGSVLSAFIASYSLTGGSEGLLFSLGMTALLLVGLIGLGTSLYRRDRQFYTLAKIPVTVIDRLSWS
jgi:uncharacterized membrane protein